MTIGERIKRARKAKRMGSQALADALDVTRSCVTNWEADISHPPTSQLRTVARVLGLELDDLVPR